MKKIVFLAVLFLSACASNRDVAGDFTLINSSSVAKPNLPAFIDCVNSKFHDSRGLFGVSYLNRQQHRPNMNRIEVVSTDAGPVLSADIYDDGRVEMFETTLPIPANLQEERNGFDFCLKKHQ